MRMIFVIITGLTLMLTITVAWYVSQTIVLSICEAFIGEIGTGEGYNIMSLVQFCNIIWGPLFDGIILFWMIASAQARDVESDIYG
jgi:hypothetical protein